MNFQYRVMLNLVVVFSITFYSFQPQGFTNSVQAQAAPYSISGRVTAPDGSGVAGVNIHAHANVVSSYIPFVSKFGNSTASGRNMSQSIAAGDYVLTTDTDGNYSFADLPQWQFTVFAEKDGVIFSPLQQVVNPATVGAIDFQIYVPDPVVPPTTEPLSSQTEQYLQAISADGSIYSYSQITPELQQLSVGDFMVAAGSSVAPNGFLRRVTAISGDGLVVTTAPATLEDAIQDGAVYQSHSLSPANVRSVNSLPGVILNNTSAANPVTFSFAVNDVVLYDKDEDLSTKSDQITANGTIDFELDYEFYLNISNFKLQKLTFAASNTLRDKLTVSTNVALASIKEEKILSTQTFQPITVMVGVVPIVFVPQLDVVVGMDGSVKIGISASVEQAITSHAGVSYTDPIGWGPISEVVTNFNFTPPQLTMEATFKAYYGVRLNLYFYGVAGPYVKVTAYGELKITPLEQPSWTLYGGIDIPSGFRATEALNKIFKLPEYEAVAVSVKRKIADSGIINHPPAIPSNPNPVSGATGQSQSLVLRWTGSDSDGDSLNYDIYLGTTNPPTALVSASQMAPSYSPGSLKFGTHYYWRIVVWDEHGASTTGPVWSFTTSAYPGSIVVTDATTSHAPSTDPNCYIISGYNLPYASPRSIQIYWPLTISIDGSTQGTSTFSFWAKNWGALTTHILVNGKDAGGVVAGPNYDWVTRNFPTAWLNKGSDNMIEIWTTDTPGFVYVGCDSSRIDDVGAQNAIYIRNNGGTAYDNGPYYGEATYAKLTVRKK
jgi:hypothetical protein